MKTHHARSCTNCGTDSNKGQWWGLRNYFGISGYFCPKCYDKVSHDSYNKPNHPGEYLLILLKQSSKDTQWYERVE